MCNCTSGMRHLAQARNPYSRSCELCPRTPVSDLSRLNISRNMTGFDGGASRYVPGLRNLSAAVHPRDPVPPTQPPASLACGSVNSGLIRSNYDDRKSAPSTLVNGPKPMKIGTLLRSEEHTSELQSHHD